MAQSNKPKLKSPLASKKKELSVEGSAKISLEGTKPRIQLILDIGETDTLSEYGPITVGDLQKGKAMLGLPVISLDDTVNDILARVMKDVSDQLDKSLVEARKALHHGKAIIAEVDSLAEKFSSRSVEEKEELREESDDMDDGDDADTPDGDDDFADDIDIDGE